MILRLLFMLISLYGLLYAAPGDLDETFGTDGAVTTDIDSSREDMAFCTAIGSDGKIVVGGSNDVSIVNSDFVLARYETNGTLDSDFGTSGIVKSSIGTSDVLNKVLIQNNGKIIALGASKTSPDVNITVTRYDSNGSLDDSFGSGGVVISAISGSTAQGAYGGALQKNGKIIAVGGATGTSGDSDLALVRYEGDILPLAPIYYLLLD